MGKDIRKNPSSSSTNNPGEVKTNADAGAVPNTKIAGVKTWKDSNKNKSSLKDRNVIEISRAEVTGIV